MKGDNPEADSKVSSESDSATPRTPRSGMFEDSKFFGSSFSLENLSDEMIKAGVSAKGKTEQNMAETREREKERKKQRK